MSDHDKTPMIVACKCGHTQKTHMQSRCLACVDCTGFEAEEPEIEEIATGITFGSYETRVYTFNGDQDEWGRNIVKEVEVEDGE